MDSLGLFLKAHVGERLTDKVALEQSISHGEKAWVRAKTLRWGMFHRSSGHSEETGMANGADLGFILGKMGSCEMVVSRVAAQIILSASPCLSF